VARVVNPSRSKTAMNEREKSDRLVVPVKSANKSFWDFAQELAERAEGRGLAKGNMAGKTRLSAIS